NLGSSWRASGLIERAPRKRNYLVRRDDPDWRYRPGNSEASDPISAWRAPDFREDDSWATGQAPFGFGDDDDNTVLKDMEDNYTSIFLRREFTLGAEIPDELKLAFFIDDGFVLWINGVEVARWRMDEKAEEITYDLTAERSTEARWVPDLDLFLQNASTYLREGRNVIAVQVFNFRITSGDVTGDFELFVPGDQDFDDDFLGFPTPGVRNSVLTETPPPNVRQVNHSPLQPKSDTPFLVTAKVTDPDGVKSVELYQQIVAPGEYLPAFLPMDHATLLRTPEEPLAKNPEFENSANWSSMPMRDDGKEGDELADDGIYTAIIPGQPNRTLFRYRLRVTDKADSGTTVPYGDDPSLNFAAFVYDGVPGYEITRRTILRDQEVGYVYPPEVMESLAVYHLITRSQDIVQCVAATNGRQIPQGYQSRVTFNWEGAFVYEGFVYDHVRYRLRGANGRYQVPPNNGGAAGKRHWRIKFNHGNLLRARDRYGERHETRWRTLNTGRMFGNRIDGNWGLGDQVNDIVWNAYRIPAPYGHVFHWRVVDGPEEAPTDADGQYHGDFWGIARAFENYDSRFLDNHDVPKGNLYKLVNQERTGLAQRRYHAPEAVARGEDHDNIERNLRSNRDATWLNNYVNYPAWYRYHAIVQAIQHYDYWPDANKNATWYFEPTYTEANNFLGRLWTLPFDTDATWGPSWNGGQDRQWDAIFSGGGKREFQIEYRNHVREVRDLFFQRDQLEQVIRHTASFMEPLQSADVDRWRSAPIAAGRQYFGAGNQSSVQGKAADMMRFAFTGGSWPGSTVGPGGRAAFLDTFADRIDRRDMPERPEINYDGPQGHPLDLLQFSSSPFADPQGADDFAAMKWRLAEVSPLDPTLPIGDPAWRAERIHLELETVWELELNRFDTRVQIPSIAVREGKTYRVRVRMKDQSGLWGHWSEPLEFTAGAPTSLTQQQTSLRITEIMYQPLGDSEFEFIEVQNVGQQTVDLRQVRFTNGIDFDFVDGSVRQLEPGAFVVVVKDARVFASRYGTEGIQVAGEYRGFLGNAGERIELEHGKLGILDFNYEDGWHPATDGLGRSLVIVEANAATETWSNAEAWRASSEVGGSPGREDPAASGGLQRTGDVNQDGRLNISDAVGILRALFLPNTDLPCGDGTLAEAGNRQLVDFDGSGNANLTDAIALLNWLFGQGPAPVVDPDCQVLEGCADACLP
ncbi:MAG: lamin tail domain-containing protein, partial [Planctomycetota bacterium]